MRFFKFLLIIFLFAHLSSYLLANNLYDIEINASKDIDKDNILSIIKDLPHENIDEYINNIIKKLYQIGIFSNISVTKNNNNILINIQEYPKILSIKFVNNERFRKEELLEIYNQNKHDIYFNPTNTNKYIDELNSLYKSYGYNQIDIQYELNEYDDLNNVDLIFNFNEGKISKINKVFFIGNESFTNKRLLELIYSKPKRDILFFLRKNYKKYKSQNDILIIKQFYQDKGYKDINVSLKEEYIEKNNRFNIYYYIEENKKFIFDKFEIDINDLDLKSDQIMQLNNVLSDFTSKYKLINNDYKRSSTSKLQELLIDYLYSQGLLFFKIDVLEQTNNETINILYQISSTKIKYVNTINIYGNTRTLEKVIRREIQFSEGDAINTNLISRSTKKINNLNIFKNVEINEIYLQDDKVDVDVIVEEIQTGSFKIGLSLATLEGTTLIAGLNEKNIGGVGRKIDLEVNTSSANTKYLLNIEEPYIFNKDLNLIYGISYANQDYTNSSSYKLNTFNSHLGVKYNINDDISHVATINYDLKDYEITKLSDVSDSILNKSGTNIDISLINSLTYNKLDSFIRPSDGNYLNFFNKFSPITNSTNGYIKNIFTIRKYKSFNKNILSFQTKLGNVISLQNNSISDDDKFSLGGRWLRGFDSFGAGPRDSITSYKGGNNLFITKLDLVRPIFNNIDNPIDINIFSDFGKVFGNKTNPIKSNESIRSSYGFGLKFYTPIGPIGLSWAFPIQDEDYDVKRMFLFNIGNLN